MSQYKNILSMFNNVTTQYVLNRAKLIELIKNAGLSKKTEDYNKQYKNYITTNGLNLEVIPEQYADYLIYISSLNISTYTEYNDYAGNFIFTYLFLNKIKPLQSATLISNTNFNLSWLASNIKCTTDYNKLITSDLTYISTNKILSEKIYANSISKHFAFNISVNQDWVIVKGVDYKEFKSTGFGIGITKKTQIEKIVEKDKIEQPILVNQEDKIEQPILVNQEDNPGLVSIVIPCYNSSKYVSDTLQSIKTQTYNHYEIIVVDDGSTKSELNTLRKIIKNFDGQIKFFENSNHGACHARNFGASYANGEFILFCDSDVILDINYLKKTIQALHSNPNPNSAWAYCNFSIGQQQHKFHKFDMNKLKKSNFCSTMSLIRSKYFVGFNETLKRLQDWEMFYRMAKRGLIGIWIDDLLFNGADRPGITKNSINWQTAIGALKKLHPEL